MRVVRRKTVYSIRVSPQEFEALRVAAELGMEMLRTPKQRRHFSGNATVASALGRERFQRAGGPLGTIDEVMALGV